MSLRRMTSNPIYFTVPGEGSPVTYDDEERLLKEYDGVGSKRNFWCFCILFSIVHAAVDAVLAFSAAELGTNLGSTAGFILYIFYTMSAFLFAKLLLQYYGAKIAVFFGLLGMLIYVATFFISIMIPSIAWFIFLIGAGIGGVGAGLLWTAQGSYYASNAHEFSSLVDSNRDQTLTQFAAIFALFYLSFETCFKFVATIFFWSSTGEVDLAWRPTVFGLYASSATIAIILYYFIVQDFDDENSLDDAENEVVLNSSLMQKERGRAWTASAVCFKLTSVARTLSTQPKLLLLLPYQLCFGFSVGLMDTYVNGVIVKKYIGDGYIGLLAGITTLTAALLATPYSMLSTKMSDGSYVVMILGGACFFLGGLLLVVLTDQQIAYWPMIILYYILHGAARGVWENTNKAMISIFFSQPDTRDAGYAAVYFTSGLAGALGFLFFQFMTKTSIALLNLALSIAAILCFHFAYILHQRVLQQEQLVSIQNLTRTCRSDSESSLDTLSGVMRERDRV